MATSSFSPIGVRKSIIKKFHFDPIETDGAPQAEFSIQTEDKIIEDREDVLVRSCEITVVITVESQKALEVVAYCETETHKTAFVEDDEAPSVSEIALFNTVSLTYSFLRVAVETTTRSFGIMLPMPTIDVHSVLEQDNCDED